MKSGLPRFAIFLALAAAIHLSGAWVCGRWGWRWNEAAALPRLDMSSVELSIKSDESQNVQPAQGGSGGDEGHTALPQPPVPTEIEPPAPKVESPDNRQISTEVKSEPLPARDFFPNPLLPQPPESSRSETSRVVSMKPPESQTPATSPSPAVESAPAEASATESAKVDVPPAPETSFKPPKYPKSCLRRGEVGIVSLDIDVDIFGHAAGVSVAISSGFAKLDAAAVAAMRGARFTPATSDGKPVPGRIRIPVIFRLKE